MIAPWLLNYPGVLADNLRLSGRLGRGVDSKATKTTHATSANPTPSKARLPLRGAAAGDFVETRRMIGGARVRAKASISRLRAADPFGLSLR